MAVFKALTIAGSDSGGGAGIQADLKTFQELGVFGMSAITALTAQNTKGVQGVYPIGTDFVRDQIHSIGVDLSPDAVKTGMLYSAELIETVTSKIVEFGWYNLIVDPVMIAKGGETLLQKEAIEAMKRHLLPLALCVTPNIPEAEVLTGLKIETMEDRKEAARTIHGFGARTVVIKGGHQDGEATDDLLFDGVDFHVFSSKKIITKNTHGTGCTFSAALTAETAKGKTIFEAVQLAKDFIQAAIEEDMEIGSGHGPTNHWAYRKRGLVGI